MAACGADEADSACWNCAVNPSADPCRELIIQYLKNLLEKLTRQYFSVTCCDTMIVSSPNAEFMQGWYGSTLTGTYTRYTDTPTQGERSVYKHESREYCLFYHPGANEK